MARIGKKSIIKIISVLLAIVIVIAGSFGGYILYRFNCDKSGTEYSYESVYSAEQVKLYTDNKGEFRVLKINDTHMFGCTSKKDKHTLSDIRAVLCKTPCDFIVLDGDIVDGFNLDSSYDKYAAFSAIAELIEEFSVPWTFAPGNNDFEIDGDNEAIIAFLMQYDHFVYGNTKGVDGSMQFVAEVYHGDKLVHCIAIMDSGARSPKAIGPYQAITDSQAKWLNDEVEKRNVKTSVFFHMPTNEFQKAFDNGEVYKKFDMYENNPYDEIEGDYVLDDVIKDNENITLLSCGHQHSNNMCSFYNGRYYQLSSVSGYSAGHKDYIEPSCTLTVIKTDKENVKKMYSFKQIEG